VRPSEVKRMIRKLSRRRHRVLKSLLRKSSWPATYRDEIRGCRSEISDLTNEINTLMGRL